MRNTILSILLSFPLIITAQNNFDCDQLAIDFIGITEVNGSEKLVLEVSNKIYTGTLYYYPGFVLLNEAGDTIAKERVRYYGIGLNFQTHYLEMKTDISFPFTGILELHGSYYQTMFCSLPVEIPEALFTSIDDVKKASVKISTNLSNENLIIDLGGLNINVEALNYYISISNENGEEVYTSNENISISSVLVETLGGTGEYYISIWDDVQKKLLPLEFIEIE